MSSNRLFQPRNYVPLLLVSLILAWALDFWLGHGFWISGAVVLTMLGIFAVLGLSTLLDDEPLKEFVPPELPFPRLPKNAPGDFYTTGECMACAMPESIAPECLAPLGDDNFDTYFLRQPVTQEEVDHVCEAAQSCCVAAIRYAGRDREIRRRLGEKYCDVQVSFT